jgi:aryl carrier-like protein
MSSFDLELACKSLKSKFAEFANDSKYEKNQEIYNEIDRILYGLDSIKLEGTFINNSDLWRKQLNGSKISNESGWYLSYIYF